MIRRKGTTKSRRKAVVKAIEQTTNRTFSYDEIQRKAYELFEQRGCEHGNDLADWYQAEQLLRK